MSLKKCSKCGKVKPITEFPFKWYEKYGERRKSWCKECCNKSTREYYRKNRERLRANAREKRIKNPEKYRQIAKKFRKKNREIVLKRDREYYHNNKEKRLKVSKEWTEYKRDEIMKLIGDKCLICNSGQKIIFHEIHGKEHKPHDYNYVLNHIEDFVSLCWHCHIALHHLAKSEKIKIGEFLQLLKLLRN